MQHHTKNYGDKSEGFYRRLIIIRFNYTVPQDKRDPELLEKFRMEAGGIFMYAPEGLYGLINNNYFCKMIQSDLEINTKKSLINHILPETISAKSQSVIFPDDFVSEIILSSNPDSEKR